MRKFRHILLAMAMMVGATAVVSTAAVSLEVVTAGPASADHCGTFHQYSHSEQWNEWWQDSSTGANGAWYVNHVHADVYGHYDNCTWQLEWYDYHNQYVQYTSGPYYY
jgi:hypothetical protein